MSATCIFGLDSETRAKREHTGHLQEVITIKDYKKELNEQLQQLNQYISFAEKRLKKSKNIELRAVSTSVRKHGFQYYLVEDGKRTYVKTRDLDVVRGIVQKDYDESMYKALVTMRDRIGRFLKVYDMDSIEKTYSNLSAARKQLVNPLIPSDEQYIEQWYLRHTGGQNPFPEQGIYHTSLGERVRSKSEMIIANLFDKHNIPYRYEPKLELEDGTCMFPDFIVLNVRCRKTVYWEHFGLVSDGDYARKALQKLELYEENGFVVGEDLLFSTESAASPLNVRQLEAKIQKYLL